MQLGYFQVVDEPVSTWVHEIFEFRSRYLSCFVPNLWIPAFHCLSSGYLRTRSGCSWTASDKEQKMIPRSASLSLNVVATETLSRTASTATPARRSCSWSGIPNFA